MKVVYPLTDQKDYTELNFSLRSLEKFLVSDFEVIIVGEKLPDWITNVTQISLPNNGTKHTSVRRKIIAALQVSQAPIFYMNDDFYLTREMEPEYFPYYTSGKMDKMAESGTHCAVKTLKEMGRQTRYYGHYPCVINPDFPDVISNFGADCLNKSTYCNYIDPPVVEIADCKINSQMSDSQVKAFIKPRPSFSTGTYGLKSCLPVLGQMFPNPSKFEI